MMLFQEDLRTDNPAVKRSAAEDVESAPEREDEEDGEGFQAEAFAEMSMTSALQVDPTLTRG